jgi:signal transduction histidine kinase
VRLPRVFRTSIFRYTLNYLVGVSVAVFVMLALVYASLTFGFFRDMNAMIGAETAAIVAAHGERGVDSVAEVIGERIQRPAFPRLFYLLVDSGGRKVTGNLARWPERLGPVEEWVGFGRSIEQWLRGGADYEFVGASASFPGGERLLVARHYQDIAEYLRLTLTVLTQAMITTIVLGAIGALWLALIMERRISDVNRSIATILSGDLGQRIPVAPVDDDFARLIVNFNHMLDRIAQLMEGVKHLSDNIAHDLRTPLTRLRNRLASIELDELGNHRESVAVLIEEADTLLATFNALLRIAQIESGQPRAAFAPTDLVTILGDVCEFYEPLAAERAQRVATALPASCHGVFDRDLLFQAFANLLDNAIKYAPEGGRIGVRLAAQGDVVQVCIEDDGPGIPLAERDKVFQRFYRVEASRGLRPGNGLGLSLVQAVIALHGGTVRLEDNQPGLRVRIELPLAA